MIKELATVCHINEGCMRSLAPYRKIFLSFTMLTLSSCGVMILKGKTPSIASHSSSNTATDSTSLPIANDFTSASVAKNTLSGLIVLSYTDADGGLATSCTISSPVNLTVSRACACSAGVCSLKILPGTNYTGDASFSFSVTVAGVVSNIALATVPVILPWTQWIGGSSNPTGAFSAGQSIYPSFGDGAFTYVTGSAVDATNDRLYVVDNGHRIQKFVLSTGAFVGAIGNVVSSTGTCVAGGAASGWCTGGFFASGSENGMFVAVPRLSLDVAAGFFYVADSSNRIQKFNLSTGAFVGAIGRTSASSGTCPTSGPSSGWCTGGTFVSSTVDGGFASAGALAIDVTYHLLAVADGGRVQKFNLTTGAFIGAIGNTSASSGTCPASGAAPGWCTGGTFAQGAGDGMFKFAALTLDIDSAGDALFVNDWGNHRIMKITLSSGAFVGAIGKTTASSGTCPASGAASGWCTGGTFDSGSGDGMFYYPSSLNVDPVNGHLFVGEGSNYRVQKINLATGAFVGALGKTSGSSGTCPASGVTGWCTGGTFTYGSGEGMFRGLYGVTADPVNGFLYVANTDGNRLDKFDLGTGVFVASKGTTLSNVSAWTASTAAPLAKITATYGSAAFFDVPTQSVIDATNGFFYVADSNHNRVAKFNLTTGAFVGAIGKTSSSTGTCPASGPAPGWCTGGTFVSGGGDGVFSWAVGALAIDIANGFLYVAEYRSIQKINLATGAFIGAIGKTTASSGTCPASGPTNGWCTGGTFGDGAVDGTFTFASSTGLWADTDNGFLYAADQKHRVQKFDLATGVFVGAIGLTSASSGTCPASGVTTGWCTGGTFASGAGDGMFNYPKALGADVANDFLFIGDAKRIQKFNLSTGTFLGAIGNTSASSGTCAASGATAGWCTGGTFATGTGDGMFGFAGGTPGLAVDDNNGFLYVSDPTNHRVQKFNLSSGAFIGATGYVKTSTVTCAAQAASTEWCTGGQFGEGQGNGMFYMPEGISWDPTNNHLFVIDSWNSRVMRVDLN